MATTLSQMLAEAQEAKDTIQGFLHQFEIGNLLRKCRAHKIKGFPVLQIFIYLLGCMFSPISTYMAMRIGTYKEDFSKNTIYRFCNDAGINWHKFIRLLSERVDLYRKGMASFEGNTPTYHLELREHPTLVWDFHSLLLNIRILFSMALTDEKNPLRICKQCQRPFIAGKADAEFCSPACREQHKKKGKR